MIERINEVKKVYRITNRQISDESGISINTVNKQLQGLYKVDVDVLAAIVRLCPEVDATWLLTGSKKYGEELRNRISDLEADVAKIKVRLGNI